MIVDVHTHLGWDHTFDEDFTEELLLDKMRTHGIDVQIVQPGTCHDGEDTGYQQAPKQAMGDGLEKDVHR